MDRKEGAVRNGGAALWGEGRVGGLILNGSCWIQVPLGVSREFGW